MHVFRILVLSLALCLLGGTATAGAAIVGAGEAASCTALPSGGPLNCWGSRSSGTLGDGGSAPSDMYDPLVPVGMGSGVTAVSMTGEGGGSSNRSCAIVSGAAKCWGVNTNGEIGDGTTTTRTVPTQVTGLESGVTQIDTHTSTTCAIVSGTAKCWGSPDKDLTGAVTNADVLTPHDVVGGAGALAVAPGWRHECIVIADGSVRCYGDNTNDQLGGGNPTLPGPVSRIAAGMDHNCVLIADGVRCWGNGTQLGWGSTADSVTPVTPVGMDSGVTASTRTGSTPARSRAARRTAGATP
jgi:hypothetical protein